ncbi:hypothetical protein ACFPN7_31405 [Amycolatopsis halotolerans]|uniref:hypothetical protein n=1 Tax=Amycolatopsis halotolerans TaxID=330083 RepID=UPI00362392D9
MTVASAPGTPTPGAAFRNGIRGVHGKMHWHPTKSDQRPEPWAFPSAERSAVRNARARTQDARNTHRVPVAVRAVLPVPGGGRILSLHEIGPISCHFGFVAAV